MFYIGTLVIVQATAFVMTLCFEMPFGALEKIVMSKIMGGGKKRVPNSASSKDKSEENQAAKISSPDEAQFNHLGEAHGPAPESFSDKESEALASAQNVVEKHGAKMEPLLSHLHHSMILWWLIIQVNSNKTAFKFLSFLTRSKTSSLKSYENRKRKYIGLKIHYSI